jgi:hypothetical protein
MMFLSCEHESFNVQKNQQLCSLLLKPCELVQHSARLVGGTNDAEVKESNKFVGIVEEASTEMKVDDDSMLGGLVLIINFNFFFFFVAFVSYFLLKA